MQGSQSPAEVTFCVDAAHQDQNHHHVIINKDQQENNHKHFAVTQPLRAELSSIPLGPPCPYPNPNPGPALLTSSQPLLLFLTL